VKKCFNCKVEKNIKEFHKFCQNCNKGLGCFKNNEDNLVQAIKYLELKGIFPEIRG